MFGLLQSKSRNLEIKVKKLGVKQKILSRDEN